jgi:hypothetical protein
VRRLLPAIAVCVLTSCSLGNTIDVCSRPTTVEGDLNGLTDGDQTLHTRNALAPMPLGGAMAVWTSTLNGASEVRGASLTSTGVPQKTCDAASGEFTFSSSGQNADQAAIAPAPASGDLGVIIYRAGAHEIWAAPISDEGCLIPTMSEPQPFLLSQAPGGATVSDPSIAYLGDHTFVVVWTQEDAGAIKARLLMRRFKLSGLGAPPEFLPTPNGTANQPADAVTLDAPHANASLVSLPDGAAMVFFDLAIGTPRIELVRFNADLSIRWGPLLLRDPPAPTGLLPDGVRANLAWAPDSFLVGWLAGDLKLQPVVEGIFISGDGQYLSAPQAPQGGAFKLATSNGTVQGSVSIVGLQNQGFLAAWQEDGTGYDVDHDGFGIRAVGFDANGAVRFANRVCKEGDFQLNASTAADQTLPTMTLMPDGSLLAAWVSNEGNVSAEAHDRSGTGLKIVDLTMRELFPLK